MPRWSTIRTNYFAHHVKAHVFDTDCRAPEGRDWLAAQAVHWKLGNNLIHHLWWHRALLELDLGELDAVVASYDANIRNFDEPMTRAAPDHYVDLQNAASMLWRLEQLGVAVGDRWQELADKAEARIGDAGHFLLVPHLMLALAATGRAGCGGSAFLAALRDIAAPHGPGDRRCRASRSARRRWRTGAATTRASSICWRRGGNRSGCLAAAMRSAISSCRC